MNGGAIEINGGKIVEEFRLFLLSCGGERSGGKGDYNWVSGDQVIKLKIKPSQLKCFFFG